MEGLLVYLELRLFKSSRSPSRFSMLLDDDGVVKSKCPSGSKMSKDNGDNGVGDEHCCEFSF